MVKAEDLKRELGSIVITDQVMMKPYATDASYFEGVTPLAVAIPENVQQVRKIMSYCNSNGIKVVARGGGTSLTGSSVPTENSILLSMARFDRVIEVKPEDRFAIVEPGVRLDSLNEQLSDIGFFYPPDPASSIAATVGGSISTNAGGLRASMYGTTKNWILGLEVVLPNGDLIKTGGKVLKRTAGYDLTSMFVGAEGTLGIITKATLKIWPKPEATGRILAYYRDIETIGQAISEMKRIGITPLIAEFLDRITMDSLQSSRGIIFPKDANYMLIIDVASEEVAIEGELEKARKVLEKYRPTEIETTRDKERMEKIYEARKGAYSSLLNQRKTMSEKVVIGDIVVPASHLPEALREASAKLKEHNVKAALFGHIADGNIHANIYADLADEKNMSDVEAFQKDLAMISIKHGGSVSAEHGIGLEKKELLEMEHQMNDNKTVLDLMKSVRGIFDPNGILNRGKMFD